MMTEETKDAAVQRTLSEILQRIQEDRIPEIDGHRDTFVSGYVVARKRLTKIFTEMLDETNVKENQRERL